MEKTDYKSMLEYSSPEVFFRDDFTKKTEAFLREVIELIPKGENWQKEYIFDPDIELYKNEPNPKGMLIHPIELKELLHLNQFEDLKNLPENQEYPFVDINAFDWSFYVNLLDKRFFDNKNDSLSKFLGCSRKLRNTASHSYKTDDARFQLNGCIIHCNAAKNILINEHKTDSEKTSALFDSYKEYLEKVKSDFSIVEKEIIITEENGYNISPELLYNYNIFVDETALLSKYSSRYISALTDVWNYPVIVCQSTIDYFANCIRNNTDGKDKAAEILKNTLNINQKANKKFNLISKVNEYAVDSAEEIVGLIKNKIDNENDKKALFCVITEKKSLATELWGLQKGDTLIVVHGKNDGTAELFGHPENELNETPKKLPININVVFESSETADSNKDSSKNTDTTKEPVITHEPNSSTNKNNNKQADYSKNESKNEYKSDKTVVAPVEQRAKTKVIQNPKVGDTIILDRGCFDNEKLKITGKLHSGGEGTIFEIEDYGSFVIKMYHNIPSEELCNKLIAMVDTYAADSENSFYEDTCCWPKALVYDRSHKNILGYAMDYKKNAVTLDSLLTKIQLDDKSCGITRNELVNICIEICKNFTELNNICNKAVLMGDINLKNILVTEDKKKVVFIDADSYQFKDHLCTVGTPDFTSPRLHKIFDSKEKVYANTKRNIHDENFAIAVLIFYILFIKEFPFNSTENSLRDCIVKGYYSYSANRDSSKQSRRNYIYKNLTKKMQELFNDAFKNKRYIDANEWINPLTELRSAILSGRSSDELFPTCFLSEGDNSDRFEKKVCKQCKKTFMTAKSNSSSDMCQDCLIKKMLSQSKIIRVTCSKCGAKFTTNEWDYAWLVEQSSNKNSIECPDCNPNIKFSKKAEFENSENFERKLLENMSYAFKNLQENLL